MNHQTHTRDVDPNPNSLNLADAAIAALEAMPAPSAVVRDALNSLRRERVASLTFKSRGPQINAARLFRDFDAANVSQGAREAFSTISAVFLSRAPVPLAVPLSAVLSAFPNNHEQTQRAIEELRKAGFVTPIPARQQLHCDFSKWIASEQPEAVPTHE